MELNKEDIQCVHCKNFEPNMQDVKIGFCKITKKRESIKFNYKCSKYETSDT